MGSKVSSKVWTLSCGDVSGTPALYVRKVDSQTYAVCEVNLWDDLDSSATELYGKYNVQSGTVDILSDAGADALRSCGFHVDAKSGNIVDDSGRIVAEYDTTAWILCTVDCMWGYGAKDVACDISGNNLRKLVREARAAV